MIKKICEIVKKKNVTRIIILLLLLILGLFLIISDNNGTTSSTSENYSNMEYDRILEARLQKFLESTEGIEKASVFITVSHKSKDLISSTVNKSETQITGVVIACTDGDRSLVKKKISELVSTVLGIDTNKIRITAIDKS